MKVSFETYRTADPKEYIVFSHQWQDRIHPVLAGRVAYLAMIKNKKATVTSGFRSIEEQMDAANAAMTEHKNDGYYQVSNGAVYNKNGQCMVSSPGNSSHNWGYAIDSFGSWLAEITNEELAKYGLRKPMSYENWHIECIERLTLEQKETEFYEYMGGYYRMDTKTFQMICGLKADGIAGNKTMTKVQEMLDCIGEMTKSTSFKAPGINVNGHLINSQMDVKPVTISGRIFAPIRFIAEALGKTVGFDSSTNTAMIK